LTEPSHYLKLLFIYPSKDIKDIAGTIEQELVLKVENLSTKGLT
jgi:hypothetical protein